LATQNSAQSVATSINDNGEIAGAVGSHAAAWLPNGTLRLFQMPSDSGSFGCEAYGINIYGAAVGHCAINSQFITVTPATFNWHGPTTLATSGTTAPYTAISNDGWIAGAFVAGADEGGNPLAIIVSPAGQDIVLNNVKHVALGISRALAITYHGWAAGSDDEGLTTCDQAVAWLGSARDEYRLGTCGSATGLTDDWHVVGTGNDAGQTTQSQQAFVWFPGGGLQRLPGLGGAGEYSTAVAINARHHVLGTIVSGGTTHTVIWNVAH
jgi:hypothetical protein